LPPAAQARPVLIEEYALFEVLFGEAISTNRVYPFDNVWIAFQLADHGAGMDVVDAGDLIESVISAKDKNVVVLGGGDTGSDCVGTSNRQGAKSVTQIELLPQPPNERPESTPWPYWPAILRTSSSHEEGAIRKWSINTKSFKGNDRGEITALVCNEIKFENGKITGIPGTEFELQADLVLIAAGFLHP